MKQGYGIFPDRCGINAEKCCRINKSMNQYLFWCLLDQRANYTASRSDRYFLSACASQMSQFNPLNAELNPICHLLALLGPHPIFHVSGLSSTAVGCACSSWQPVGTARIFTDLHCSLCTLPCIVFVCSQSMGMIYVPCQNRAIRAATCHNLSNTEMSPCLGTPWHLQAFWSNHLQ